MKKNNGHNPESPDSVYPPKRIIIYTTSMGIIFCIIFILLLLLVPNESYVEDDLKNDKAIFVYTILIMTVAGGIGGSLYNFRGLIKHSADADYSRSYDISYYLRPIAGAISGLIVFFLLLGGVIVFNMNGKELDNSWSTFPGRMPFIVFALLAGYSSHEFMLKMKDISESIFALRRNNKTDKK